MSQLAALEHRVHELYGQPRVHDLAVRLELAFDELGYSGLMAELDAAIRRARLRRGEG